MHTPTPLVLVLAIAVCSPLLAQDEQALEVSSSQESSLNIAFSASERILFRTDLDAAAGDVFTARTNLGLEFSGKVHDEFSLSLGLSGVFSRYDFEGVASPLLMGANSLDNGTELGARLSGRHTIDERWSALGGVFIRAGFADGADIGDAFTFGGFAAAGYKHSDTFSIDFGILVSSRLEDDAFVIPYIALNWKINDTLTLSSTGLSARLEAALDSNWTVYLDGRYESYEYRLDDSFAALPGGAVRDDSFPIAVGVRYAPNSTLSIAIEGGIVVERQFEFYNRSENEIATIETDSGAFLGIRIAIGF